MTSSWPALHYGIKVAGSPSARHRCCMTVPPMSFRSFSGLSPAVFQAVDRHTVGTCDMTPLDMVVFVADAIGPTA
ncbi:MAG: hypothetical protein ACLU0O_01760 [Collinsella sp.]